MPAGVVRTTLSPIVKFRIFLIRAFFVRTFLAAPIFCLYASAGQRDGSGCIVSDLFSLKCWVLTPFEAFFFLFIVLPVQNRFSIPLVSSVRVCQPKFLRTLAQKIKPPYFK